MNKKPDNSKLVEAMKQFKAVRTVIFQEEFFKAVVDTAFYVPVSVEKGDSPNKNGKYCALMTSDGKRFLSVFSSPEELEKCYGDRSDIVGILHNFVTIRTIVTNEKSGLDGFIIDSKGENMAILREEMIPKE
ncbi:MAG: SseB family protein [Clostridia bacterium]|nr:SseB family protein [Clostridia bacterium]